MSNFDKYFKLNSLTLTVTTACNLSCDYCFEEHETKLIKPDQITKIIDIAYNNFRKNYPDAQALPVAIFGGEPFLAFKSLKALMQHARDKQYDLDVGITTNMTVLTDDILDFIDEYNIALLVSIDGTKEVHDRNRDNSYDDVARNIKKVLDRNLKYNVEARMTVTPKDAKHLFDGIKNIIDLGVDNIAPVPVTDQEWSPQELKDLEDNIDRIYKYYIEEYNDIESKRNLSLKIIDDSLYSLIAESYDHNHVPCSFGGNHWVSIGPMGEIMPCHQVHTRWEQKMEMFLGNILADTVFPDKFKGSIQAHQWDKSDDPEYTCSTCDSYNICRGGCPSENYALFGDINKTPNSWCDFVRICHKVTQKYQKEILRAKNIRNRRINILKLNLKIEQQLYELEKEDIMSRGFPLKLLDFYESILSAEDKLLPDFRDFFHKKMKSLATILEGIKNGNN